MVILPGGFSGGDEPDGSGKFIASFLRDAGIKDSIHELLRQRDGLMLGICNGFQALVKLGLVPYGEIRDEMTGDDPTPDLQPHRPPPEPLRHHPRRVRQEPVAVLLQCRRPSFHRVLARRESLRSAAARH